ncbi:Aspartate aminotransferase [Acaryochloris thomasi RCC1774]|uniref:Aminotransferase n=1 Tax=Acaryochloris thomasi RCC1774 TaxID=1764569 RepID=A0A2W1JSN5_9CYAN|nr:pyridoxal phosphate-dependent aminotransferase [Acaryochloris thomasi]PZD74185.1 Aspartate aminotransferase [Acaryochloris thomasi RCC1774]
MTAFTSRMEQVQAPIIPVIGELIRQHPGTISLGQGVVSYGPPTQAIMRISDCLQDPENHKYKAVQGIAPLLEIIAHKLQTENKIAVDAHAQVVVTAGSNMGFMNALLAITQPGDEIILQTPYYFNHEMAIATASCKAICIPTDDHYQLRLSAIEAAITDRTRAIVTISPNNPTGAVYPPEDLAAVNRLCRDRNLYHISDEAYEYFTYGQAQHVSPATFDLAGKHTISLFSLSKAYGFAGWRIGYMVIPAHLMTAVKKIQDTILICPPVVSQYAALGALEAGRDYCQDHLNQIALVHQQALSTLDSVHDLCSIPQPDGAFYVFLKVNTELNAMALVERLIKEHGVAVIPGDTFGTEKGCYLRVAYGALDKDQVAEGMGRLTKGLRVVL